jgi:diguanylate cyclase (GGDEF)-like protein/PAS domain S-box-containing protein
VADPTVGPPLVSWGGLIEAMLDAVWLVDVRTLAIVAANRAAGDLMAVDPHELVGHTMLELAATPEDQCFWGDAADGRADQIESDTLIARRDGSVVPVTRRACRVGTGDAAVFVVTLHDRSEQLRTERALEGAAADLRATLESTQDGILVTDLAGRIRNFNQRFAALWQIPINLLTQRDDDAVFDWMRRSVTDPASYMQRLAAMDDATMLQATDEVRLHSGRVFERVTMPQCTQGEPIGRVFSFRDITDKLEAERCIETLSYTDALTSLPNRRLLADRTEIALAAAKRDGTTFAILFLNLDRFNHINETLGRVHGDRVLLDVAERIKACVRGADTIARLGGDEFVVLAHQADDSGAHATAMRLLDALKRPFEQGGMSSPGRPKSEFGSAQHEETPMSFTVTASIGVALYPSDGTGLDELLRRADGAMREVKHAGRAGYRFHRSRPGASDTRSRSRMRLDHAMRMALAQGRFRLHFQPQVDLGSGLVVGAEALIRWRDPELGEISPSEFIPVAEESGFIIAIGDWVLKRAVTQAAAWRAAGANMTVSVNVSALQFQQPGFVDGVAAALREAGLPPRLLELELTESILILDAKDAMLRLQALAQLGVKLAIDDFGTGYSSLAYLKRFPIGRLKIDRTFVSGLPTEESDAAIVQAIIHMGRALRLEIVAEGVENDAQREFLAQAGCDLYQGFLYAPALDVAAFEARMGIAGAAVAAIAAH